MELQQMPNHFKSKVNYLENIPENIDAQKHYHTCWEIIHDMHLLKHDIQLFLFRKILSSLSLFSCNCHISAQQIFDDVLFKNLNNFYKIENTQDFWIYFHNLINIKLSKPVYLK